MKRFATRCCAQQASKRNMRLANNWEARENPLLVSPRFQKFSESAVRGGGNKISGCRIALILISRCGGARL